MKLFKVMYVDKLDRDTYYRVGDDNDTPESIESKEEKRFKIFMESIDEGIRLDRVYFVSEVNEIDGYEIIVGKKKGEQMKKIELVEIDIDIQKQNDANHFSLIYHITDTETGEVIEETIPNIEIKLPIEVSEIPEVSYNAYNYLNYINFHSFKTTCDDVDAKIITPESKKEMTVGQIEKELGYKIKIIVDKSKES